MFEIEWIAPDGTVAMTTCYDMTTANLFFVDRLKRGMAPRYV